MKTVEKNYDAIAQCNKCGFCHVACPIFRATGHEAGVARGRLALLRGLIEGRVKWNEELEDALFTCLGCGACTTNCFGSVPTADLIFNAREEYLGKVGKKQAHHYLFEHLLPYPKRLHFAAKAVAVGKNTGASKVAKALGLLRVFGRDLPRAENIVEKLPMTSFRGTTVPAEYTGEGKELKIGYFVGCGIDVIQVEAGKASFEALKKIGKSVTILDNCCCGLPPWSYGDAENTRKIARKNLDILSSMDLDVIVTDCASCSSFLKKYPKVFEEDKALQEKAQKFVNRVQDITEFLASQDGNTFTGSAAEEIGSYYDPHGGSGDKVSEVMAQSEGKPVVVTYHDPCHAVRGQGLKNQARNILKSLPGIKFKEMAEADWCCGGAGSYSLTHYDLSQKVLDRKMNNLKKSEADILVTSCPACMIQLSYGIRRHGLKTKVFHLSEMLALEEEKA